MSKASIPEGQFRKADYLLFPTLVQVYNLEDHPNQQLIIDTIDNFTSDKLMEWPVDIGKGKTSSTYFDVVSKTHKAANFLDQKEFKLIKQDIQNCVDEYCITSGLQPVKIAKSWFNIQEEQGHVNEHRHELSIVSGAYYPYCDKDSAPIVFTSPILGPKMAEIHSAGTEFTADKMDFVPKTGVLILFPSWLYHRSLCNKTKKRLTISFNTHHIKVDN